MVSRAGAEQPPQAHFPGAVIIPRWGATAGRGTETDAGLLSIGSSDRLGQADCISPTHCVRGLVASVFRLSRLIMM